MNLLPDTVVAKNDFLHNLFVLFYCAAVVLFLSTRPSMPLHGWISGLFPYARAALLAFVLLAVVISCALLWIHTKKLIERVKAADGMICKRCGYSLEDLPGDSGNCPECGQAYTAESNRAYWRKATVSLKWGFAGKLLYKYRSGQ